MEDTAATEMIGVGEVARSAGITIRTLHHYDELGLVVPERAASGYRRYGTRQIERLQEVLFFRELGFSLDEIGRILTAATDRVSVLQRQRALMERKAEHALDLLAAVERALNAAEKGIAMTNEEMLEVFGDFDPAEHQEEAQQRWGDTPAYRESMRRTASYTKQDWERMRTEADAINAAFLELMASGKPPESPEAMDVAERHRAHISSWFYECSIEIHEGLGTMYVTDPRFTENIDKAGAGLAEYLSKAIAANASRHRVGSG